MPPPHLIVFPLTLPPSLSLFQTFKAIPDLVAVTPELSNLQQNLEESVLDSAAAGARYLRKNCPKILEFLPPYSNFYPPTHLKIVDQQF